MKAKPILLLVVALGCGLVAMLGVQQVMSGPSETEEKPVVEEVQVLQATTEIKPFGVLDESNTKLVIIPKSAVENIEGVVTSYEEVIDRKIKNGAVKGEYILSSKLVDKNFKASAMIPKGYRVVTVKVNQTTSHSGLMQAGDRVDVILTMKDTQFNDTIRHGEAKYIEKREIQKSLTVLQNVEVFATDNLTQSTAKDQEGAEVTVKNVSLIVTPRNANLLMLCERRGVLTLSLRAFEDDNKSNTTPISDQDLVALGRGNIETTHSKKKKNPEDTNDFNRFLNSQNGENGNDTGDAKKKPVEYEWVRPKWKLVIYEGKQPTKHDVEDPNAPKIRVKVNRKRTDPNSTTNFGPNPYRNSSPGTGETQPPQRANNQPPERKQPTPPKKLD